MATDLTQFLDRPEDIEASVRKNASQLGMSLSEEEVQAKVQEVKGVIGEGVEDESEGTYGGVFDYDPNALPQSTKIMGMPPEASNEEAFQYSMTQPEASLARTRNLSKELQANGYSEELDQAKEQIAERDDGILQTKIVEKVANQEMSPEEARELMAQTPAQTADDVQFYKDFSVANLKKRHATTVEEIQEADQMMTDLIDGDFTANVAIAERLNDYMSLFTDDLKDLTGGILADLLPAATQAGLVSAVNQVFGTDEFSVAQLALRGQFTKAVREKLEEMSPDLRYNVSLDLMDAITSAEGLLTATDYQKTVLLQEVFNEEYGLLDQSIANAISVLDGLTIGWAARAAWRVARSGLKPGSNLDMLNNVNPEEASKLASAGMKQDISDITGMTPDEITEAITLPSRWEKDVHLLPTDTQKRLAEGDEILSNIQGRTLTNPMAVKPAELDRTPVELRRQLNSINNNGLYDGNIEVMKPDANDILKFRATYGYRGSDDVVVPFGSPAEATEQAARQFPDAKNVVIKKVNRTGGLEDVPKNRWKHKTRGKYVYQVEGERTAVDVLADVNRLVFNKGDVVRSGRLAKWFLDPAARFAKWISQGYDQAGDWTKGIATELAQIGKPFEKLKTPQQRQVVRLLQDYSKDPSSFDMYKLITEAGDDMAVVEGFLSLRKSFDALWHIENAQMRKSLKDQGAKSIVIDDYSGAGIKIDANTISSEVGRGNLASVYNPRTKDSVALDTTSIVKLQDDGYNFYRVLEPIGPMKKQMDYIVAKVDDIAELPTHVLKKIDGYIPRYYKDTYFVRASVSGMKNGVNQTNAEIVFAAPSRKVANEKIADLKKEPRYKDTEFDAIHDRSLTSTERASVVQGDNINLQRMFYHKRGAHIQGIDGLADVSDPIEALVKNIDSSAKNLAHSDLNRLMKKRWVDTFGNKLGLVDPNKGFPALKEEIGLSRSAGDKSADEAIELWEHIRTSEGMMTGDQVAWKNEWVKVADWIAGDTVKKGLTGYLAEKGANIALWLSNNSLNKIFRTIAFQHLIALNPFRQLYIQSQQWMFIAALAPKAAPKVLIQNKAVMLGLTKDATPAIYKAGKDLAAKSLGMSTKEYEAFIKGFKETGLPNAVDSHDFVRDNMVQFSKNIQGNIASDSVRQVGNIIKAPFKISKDVGFNLGELSNLINTFLVARVKYLSKTGKKQLTTRRDFLEVAADARSFALSMTKSGAFRYQEGALSALTQFLSIQHKAALALYGGNKAFTRQERVRLLAGQLILNGSTGLGLYWLYREARDYLDYEPEGAIAEGVEKAIVGGMYETLLNTGLSLASGEEENLNISSSLSPIGGIKQSLGDYMDVLLGNKPLIEIAAASNVTNRYIEAAKLAKAMYQHPTLTNDRELLQYVSVFGTVMSGYNQFLRARAAMRLGTHVSSSGNPTVQASLVSAFAEGLYGIPTRDVDEFYRLQTQFGTGTKKENTLFGDSEREIAEIADTLYKQLAKVTTLHTDEFSPLIEANNTPELYQLHQQRLLEAVQLKTSILALYDPIEQDRIWQLISQKATQDRVQGKDNLIDKIINSVLVGDISDPSDVRVIFNRLKRGGLIDEETPQGQKQLNAIKLLWDNLTARRDISQQLEDASN